jgi:3-hydroxyisobutyrate dehydrogenase-like beta-hydroxyacid dehydrogenase
VIEARLYFGRCLVCNESMNIAFLGLGNMGAGVAHCLLRAGHSLRVWNRTPEKMAALITAGAVGCASPIEAVQGVPLVISSLMDDASVRAVFDGPAGVIAHMAPNAIHLCTMTISPTCADWLAEQHHAHGSRYVSGPVVGRPDAAAAGTLTEFLSGDASAIEELKSVCSAFANNIVPIPGAASVANRQKLCVNFFIISQIEAMAECLTFAEKTGASPEIMAGFFDRVFAHPGLKGYAKRLLEHSVDGTGGFSMRGGLKDVNLILDAAKAASCPLDLATIIQDKMQECIERGLKDADWSAIQQVTRARAGLGA